MFQILRCRFWILKEKFDGLGGSDGRRMRGISKLMIQGNLDENDVVEISSDKVPVKVNASLPRRYR